MVKVPIACLGFLDGGFLMKLMAHRWTLFGFSGTWTVWANSDTSKTNFHFVGQFDALDFVLFQVKLVEV